MAKGAVRWLGHAFLEFTTGDGKVVLFDPWCKDAGNPSCQINADEIEKADLVLVNLNDDIPSIQRTFVAGRQVYASC